MNFSSDISIAIALRCIKIICRFKFLAHFPDMITLLPMISNEETLKFDLLNNKHLKILQYYFIMSVYGQLSTFLCSTSMGTLCCQ